MFRSILVAMDFSRCAGRAAALAAAWAAKQNAALQMVHVREPAAVGAARRSWRPPRASEPTPAASPEELLENRLAELRVVVPSATALVLRGTPPEEILRHAIAERIDLIVMGARGVGVLSAPARGPGTLAGVPLGSVADGVARASPVSVLVIADQAPLTRLVPRTIVAITDLSPAAKHAVCRASMLAREFDARLEIVHAWHAPPALDRDPLGEQMAAAARLRSEHPLAPDAPTTSYHARPGDPAALALDVVRETRADLIAMTSASGEPSPRHILAGIIDWILPIPVLVLRETS